MNPLRAAVVLALCAALAGCQGLGGATEAPAEVPAPPPPPAPTIESEIYRRAELTRAEFYEREVERLRADLRQAEESIVAMESGLRGFQSRADAVSALAEARIALDRVERKVPWREDQVREARAKLDEAALQLDRGHVGSAVFFASRAQRITTSLLEEARQVEEWSDRRLIDGQLVNLRAGPSLSHHVIDRLSGRTPVFPERAHAEWRLVRTPSGQVGWVHESLLRSPQARAPLAAPGRRRFLALAARKRAEESSWEQETRRLVLEYRKAIVLACRRGLAARLYNAFVG